MAENNLNFSTLKHDYSNIVNSIIFDDCSWPNFNLSERTEFIRRVHCSDKKVSCYQLTNMHNPKIKFSIVYFERNGLIICFGIERIN